MSGILFIMYNLMFDIVIINKRIPVITYAANTVFISNPSIGTIVYATKAVSPRKGAVAYGLFAYNAIKIQQMKITNEVIVIDAPKFNPADSSNLGPRMNKYDIVKKVVIPAAISVDIFVFSSFNLKIFSIIFIVVFQVL